MSIDSRDPRFTGIVAPGAARETLSEQFEFTEGPIWHPREAHLTFSDISGNRLYRYSEGGGISVYREPSNMANGNTYDRDGRILSCEHATSHVVRETDGGTEVIASRYDGKELNSPNDIIAGGDGSIFFTDPTYGRMGRHGVERPLQLDFRGVYRIAPDGGLHLLGRDFDMPNGLCFGLDERVMYVADTARRHIRRFTLDGDTLTGGEVFAQSPAPDGLKIDTLGNVYAGGLGGVHVYHRDDGALLGVLRTPEFCANFAWGGDDLRTLFMTASTGLYRIRVEVPGAPLL